MSCDKCFRWCFNNIFLYLSRFNINYLNSGSRHPVLAVIRKSLITFKQQINHRSTLEESLVKIMSFYNEFSRGNILGRLNYNRNILFWIVANK